MEKVKEAFNIFNKSWLNLNKFEDEDLETLLLKKMEIEDWFRWHPDHSDEPAIREQYKLVNEKIENFNKTRHEPKRSSN